MSSLHKTTLKIKGMHCPSCEILVTDSFMELKNVKEVKADHTSQTAEVTYSGSLDTSSVNDHISQFGYNIVEKGEKLEQESLFKRLFDAGVIAILLFILYFMASELHLIPEFTANSLSYPMVFLLGLVASTSTCMATSGALFLATIGKLHKKEASAKHNLLPAVSFNVGRIVSYTGFGFLLGFIGKTVTTDLQMGSFLNLFVAVFMILIGLDMLKLFSLSSLIPSKWSTGFFQKLESRFIKNPRQTAFWLGFITYWLPCGFTQTVQVYALGLANPVQSATVMFLFALGTVPALMVIGFASSSFTRFSWYPYLAKAMGVVILAIGITYVVNMANVRGFSIPSLSAKNEGTVAEEQSGVQVVKMTVDSRGYTPNTYTLKQGVPVKWILDGKNVFGCQGSLIMPKLGISRTLQAGENVIEFTPTEKGTISFSCSMGMYTGSFEVM